MAIYEQKWWKNLFSKSVKHKRIDVDNDIEAISECLTELSDDQKFLIENLEKLNDLEKQISHSQITITNNYIFGENCWYLSKCYHLSGDKGKTRELLNKAQEIIHDHAEKISDPIQRKCFLEDNIMNRKIINESQVIINQ